MKAQLMFKNWVVPAFLIVTVVLGFGIAISHAQGTIQVTPSGGATFQNTGWTPQSYTVNTAGVQGDQQVVITVSGSTSNDPYPRYLVISVNGHVLNPTALPSGSFGSGIGAYYSDVVQNSFTVTYDITQYVQGQSQSTVLIGLTTYTGSWTVNAYITGTGTQSVTVPNPSSSTPITLPLGEFLGILGAVFAIITIGLYYRSEKA